MQKRSRMMQRCWAETRKSSSACSSTERWFSHSILIGTTVVVYLHHMTAGFWIYLPSNRGSHLLIACTLCFGPEMCAESFWKERFPATGGSVCLLHCLEWSSFEYYFEIQNWWVVGGEKFVSLSLFHSSLFLSTCLHPGFPAFLVLSVLGVLLFFSLLLFHFRNSFPCFLPSRSPNKTNCCGLIYAGTPKFLLLYHIIPVLFHHKRQEKNSELNEREVRSWETRVWICKLMTDFPKYFPTPNYV